jgi:hypothetical protein
MKEHKSFCSYITHLLAKGYENCFSVGSLIKLVVFTCESLQSSAGIYLALLLLLLLLCCCMFARPLRNKAVCKLPLQQGSHARMQFGILQLHQGSSAPSCMQFGILPLQQGNSHRVHAVWYPATAAGQQPLCACSLVSCHCSRATATVCLQFGILQLHQGSSAPSCMQFGILPLQVTAAGQ